MAQNLTFSKVSPEELKRLEAQYAAPAPEVASAAPAENKGVRGWLSDQLDRGGKALSAPSGEVTFGGKAIPELSNQPASYGNDMLGELMSALSAPKANAPFLAATAATTLIPGGKAGLQAVRSVGPMIRRLLAAPTAGMAGGAYRGDDDMGFAAGLEQGAYQVGGEAIGRGMGAVLHSGGGRAARLALNPTDEQLSAYWQKKHGTMAGFDYRRAKSEFGQDALDISQHSPTTSSYKDEISARSKEVLAEKERMVARAPLDSIRTQDLRVGVDDMAAQAGRTVGRDPQGSKKAVLEAIERALTVDMPGASGPVTRLRFDPKEVLESTRQLGDDLRGSFNTRTKGNTKGVKDVMPPEDEALELLRRNEVSALNRVVPDGDLGGRTRIGGPYVPRPVTIGQVNDELSQLVNWEQVALRGTGEAADTSLRASTGPGGNTRVTVFNALEELLGRLARPVRSGGRALERFAESKLSPTNIARLVQVINQNRAQR